MAETPPFLRRARLADGAPRSGHPFDLPAVRGISRIRFGAVTLLAGDNGSGKSTLVEALAVAAGFNAEGGSRNHRIATYDSHSSLHKEVVLEWGRRPSWGWFLRAESFYGFASALATDRELRHDLVDLHAVSHGESFLEVILSRFDGRGLYILDEPEAALSIQGQMKLVAIMHDLVRAGSQLIVATHSPLLVAFPGARVYELDERGPQRVAFDEITSTSLWRRFFADPDRFHASLRADPAD